MMLKQSVSGLDSDGPTQGDMTGEIRLRELALEEKRLDAEQKRMDVEQKKIDADLQVKREQMKLELELKVMEERRFEREAEAQREQKKMEMEMRKLELTEARAGRYEPYEEAEQAEYGEVAGIDEEPVRRRDGFDSRTKHFGDTLRHVLPAMPSEISELPQFFDTIEKLYQIYQVPDDLKAKLLIPKLSSRAKSIIVRMTAENLEKYDEVKKFLLAEYKLTPREYKNRFDSAVKGNDETFVLFATRLRNLLMYYLRSRNVEDFDGVCDLLVSDRLKTCLTGGQLNYVLSLEGEDWFRPDKVATLADIHLNNRLSGNSSRPVDNRPAVANATAVNVDSQLSEYASDREPSQAHCDSPKAHHGLYGSTSCYISQWQFSTPHSSKTVHPILTKLET